MQGFFRPSRVALVAALALVVTLAYQKRSLRAQYADLVRRVAEPHPGIFVPTFSTHTLGGAPVTIGAAASGRQQVLLVFTTTCPYCRASIPAWQQLAEVIDTIKEPATETIGISLDSVGPTQHYVQENRLNYPVLLFPEFKLQLLYRARAVPLVMVLDATGRVIYSRLGPITDSSAADSVLSAVRMRGRTRKAQGAALASDTGQRAPL